MLRQGVIAVVDVGSATVHLLVARLHPNGALQPLHDESATLQLGARAANGQIPPDAAADVLAALARYALVAQRLGATQLLVVATQAVRASANGATMAQEWSAAIGAPVAILTAAEETRLSLLGAFEGVLPASALFADSGGASTQAAVLAAGRVAWQQSLPIGASSLTGAFLAHDPPTDDEAARAAAAVDAALAALPATVAPETPVITGGTARTLSALGGNGCPPGLLTPACLAALETMLRRTPSAALAREHRLPPQRARILCAGCLIVRRLVDWSGAPAWRVSAEGIREGVARAWAAHGEQWRTTGNEGDPPEGDRGEVEQPTDEAGV